MSYHLDCIKGQRLYDRFEYLAKNLPKGMDDPGGMNDPRMDDPSVDEAWRAWLDHKRGCPACSGLKSKGESDET